MSVERLTKQQARAMRVFLWPPGIDGIDPEACDAAVWDRGVRPYPTMANLERKGLVESVGWISAEEGYDYRLTPLGRSYLLAEQSQGKP